TTIRLMNGPHHCAGRVEVLHNQKWGTVCDDGWDLSDATVVCRQLGCGRALSASKQALFGQGSGHIWLDRVSCTGRENALTECPARPWGINACIHEEDAGVVCSEIQVRLVKGPNRCAGRVEVLHNDQWGTVCDDNWNLRHAKVVCRQLGCGTAVSTPAEAHFGKGSDPIWLDGVECTGAEATLAECHLNTWGIHDCSHEEDAGVVCLGNGG
ncbi:DMBT1 protein, partial [Nothoprocta pentlandii]|nr:DMBT1 protein [Nothoprocta pentlandii]